MIKLNLGCGDRKYDNMINVDYIESASPDLVWNLEKTPWPWEDNSVDYILMDHVLEHLGPTVNDYFNIIKELYRVCIHDAIIDIVVPHENHSNFKHDPTHIRPITPIGLRIFDQDQNRKMIAEKGQESKLGIMLGVDFVIADLTYVPDEYWAKKMEQGEITEEGLWDAARSLNNVCSEYRIKLKVRKQTQQTQQKPVKTGLWSSL